MIFAHLEQHLNAMLGSCLIAIFMLTTNGPRRVVTCSRRSPKVTLDLIHFEFENRSRRTRARVLQSFAFS